MALIVTLNTILCTAVTVMVVAPLVWAILTQHRDQPAAEITTRTASRASADATRRTRHPQSEPIIWPAG